VTVFLDWRKMTKNQHPTLEIFSELLVPSLSGSESQLADLIRKRLDQIDYAHTTDPAGNVQVFIPGQNPNSGLIVYASHMDEIGMVVTNIQPDGKLHVTKSGGLHPWMLGEGAVDIFGDTATIQGVLSMGSTHTPKAAEKTITWDDVHILTGLSPKELENAGIRPGVAVLPTRERRGPVIFGPENDPLVGAWTFDDRMGCVTLLRLLTTLKEENIQPNNPFVIAFTTQEEIGGHGAKYLTRSLNPDIFISIDGCPIPPGAPLELDGRPGIWTKDRLAQYDPTLVRSFSQAALAAGTQLQKAVYDGAASDASLAAYGLGIPKIACIGHVRENSHGYEVARLAVFDNLLATLIEFIKSYSLDT